jgi:hypothetical protein
LPRNEPRRRRRSGAVLLAAARQQLLQHRRSLQQSNRLLQLQSAVHQQALRRAWSRRSLTRTRGCQLAAHLAEAAVPVPGSSGRLEIFSQGDREIGSFLGSSRASSNDACAVSVGKRSVGTPEISLLALPISRSPCEKSRAFSATFGRHGSFCEVSCSSAATWSAGTSRVFAAGCGGVGRGDGRLRRCCRRRRRGRR